MEGTGSNALIAAILVMVVVIGVAIVGKMVLDGLAAASSALTSVGLPVAALVFAVLAAVGFIALTGSGYSADAAFTAAWHFLAGIGVVAVVVGIVGGLAGFDSPLVRAACVAFGIVLAIFVIGGFNTLTT